MPVTATYVQPAQKSIGDVLIQPPQLLRDVHSPLIRASMLSIFFSPVKGLFTMYVVRPHQPALGCTFSVREIGDFNSDEYEIMGSYDTHEQAFSIATLCNKNLTCLTSKDDYEEALSSQTACNLGALVHSFDRVITKLQFEARIFGHGTDWINQHPITRLYAEQIMFLSSKRDYSEAASYCEKRS